MRNEIMLRGFMLSYNNEHKYRVNYNSYNQRYKRNTYNCFGSLLIFRIFEKLLKFLLIYSKIASLSKYICVITRDHINDDICYYGNLQWNYAIWVLFLYLNVWIKRELSKFCQLKIF